MPFIYSTLTAPQNYAIHETVPDGSYKVARDIIINGGHGLTNRFGVVLQGTETEVDGKTLKLLEENYWFRQHRENGFLTVSDVSRDPETMITGLEQRDKSAPATAQDIDALYDDGVIPVPVAEYQPEGKPRARAASVHAN